MRRGAVAVALLLLPAAAEACATCIASPFGDRTYNWPYLILILLPIAVTAVIGGVMMRATGTRLSEVRPWLTRIIRPAAHPEARPHPEARQEETT